ncbi:MAG: hypothetical protein GEU91_18525 [Rhizobiales bacterium]|nr:hypothetical protein [Hyphomicrobiales bacterium]
MKYRIELFAPWRHGAGMMHPGIYRVPQDMPENLAQRALNIAGLAQQLPPDSSTARKIRGRRKGPAPENKVITASPENKADIDRPASDAARDDFSEVE